jgi:hypothetical protein
MGEPTNEERAEAARQALAAVPKYDPYDTDSITDLVTDLLHLARQEGIEPDYVTTTAQMNFDAEVEEEIEEQKGGK